MVWEKYFEKRRHVSKKWKTYVLTASMYAFPTFSCALIFTPIAVSEHEDQGRLKWLRKIKSLDAEHCGAMFVTAYDIKSASHSQLKHFNRFLAVLFHLTFYAVIQYIRLLDHHLSKSFKYAKMKRRSYELSAVEPMGS